MTFINYVSTFSCTGPWWLKMLLWLNPRNYEVNYYKDSLYIIIQMYILTHYNIPLFILFIKGRYLLQGMLYFIVYIILKNDQLFSH